MRRMLLLFTIVAFAAVNSALASVTGRRVELENQIQQRVFAIVQRADPLAIVQVQIKLKKVQSNIPMFGLDASVTPVEYDGALGSSSIDNVDVRILTQVEKVPDWIRSEVEKAVGLSEVKLNIQYEKAAGVITDGREEFSKIAKEATQSAVSSVNQLKFGVWGILAALMVSFAGVAYAIVSLAKRMESSLGKVIEEKLVPAMQTSSGGGARIEPSSKSDPQSANPLNAVQAAPGAANELQDYPVEALLTLLSDCYWTENDGYAHYLWKVMSQEQREKVLAAGEINENYFSFIRQTPPVNMDYHSDARYLRGGKEFRHASQTDVADWVKKNPKQFQRVSPMRWDVLPLSLEQRIQFAQMKTTPEDQNAPIKIALQSKPRELTEKLRIRALRPEDEQYLWDNADKIPETVRGSLRSLVWLARAPVDYQQKIFSDLDARQLAEAWVGPEAVLNKLKEALPAKKVEMLQHFLDSTTPDRAGDVFAYLVESGLTYKGQPDTQREAA